MALLTTENKIQYTANGSNTIFAFPYSFFDQADLKVYLTDLDGEDTLQTITTDYTLDPVGDSYRNGANVVFGSAPTNNYKVTIIRDLVIEQQTDYQDFSKFPADVFENDIDRRAMVEQQIEEELERTLRTPITDPSSIGLMPKATDRASKFLAFDASGDPIATAGLGLIYDIKVLTLSFSTETFKEATHGLTVGDIRGVFGIPPAVGAIRITELGYGAATTELRMTVNSSVSGTAYIIVFYTP